MRAKDVAYFAAELAEDAADAHDRVEMRRRAVARLRGLVGFETVYWGEPWGAGRDPDTLCSAPGLQAQGALARFASDRARFDVPDAIRAVRRTGGVAVGEEVFTAAERDRLPIYTDVLRPAGIRSYIFCEMAFRGRAQSTLTLSRHGRCRPFGSREKEVVRAVRSSLALVEAAHGAPGGAGPAVTLEHLRDRHGLTRREAEVAAHVARGLGNKEIAHLLGTSPDTVRKQTIRVYAKMRVRGRVQLAAAICGPPPAR